MHNGAKLRRFVLKTNDDDTYYHRACNWILNATVICEAEELHLSFKMLSEKCFFLSPSTFVRVIRLRFYHSILKLPSPTNSNRFSSLQVLDIRGIRLDPQNISDDWVSSLFPVFKKLKLQEVEEISNLSITSSSLECLKIEECAFCIVVVSAPRLQSLGVVICYTDREFDLPPDDLLFRIYAPSLQKFSWIDDHYVLNGSSMCLPTASIDAPSIIWSSATNQNENKNLLLLLQFINHAKSVTLSFVYSCKDWFTQDSPRYMLDNVQNLEVFCQNFREMSTLASFFGILSNLKTLTMRCMDRRCSASNMLLASETHDFDIEYWESQDVAFIHQLKEANIKVHHSGLEVGLIKYLIKHAKALNRMTVTFASHFDISRLRRVREKLSEFYETFSDETLDFVLN
ncbi:uncharacterized protein LOC132275352 [Cornus florida]|uniref:uncharacterized protein LOC132275352 n=1 Tax=Cornus florida TaxID=4283 RepID=UPI00289D4091|nr:uncharacterized protein LOC132275352 [Cornus florida]XP_059632802.1 uncharacterized protein LOC132275352 [Cornus florida]XP_059632803.1 uncharacterized protein LOC132275352 [Cornus florida]